MTTLDVDRVRRSFPALDDGLARFDGPGGSLVPREVAEAVAAAMAAGLCQRGTLTAAGAAGGGDRRSARVPRWADLLGADPGGIVFGRSMTAMTFDLARTLARDWGPGDEVVVTRLDHDADIRPWVHRGRAGRRDGAVAGVRPRSPPSSTTSRRCCPTAPGWSP